MSKIKKYTQTNSPSGESLSILLGNQQYRESPSQLIAPASSSRFDKRHNSIGLTYNSNNTNQLNGYDISKYHQIHQY